jgi:hypothetical protein
MNSNLHMKRPGAETSPYCRASVPPGRARGSHRVAPTAPAHPPAARRRAAFALLEVMVAVAILTLSMGALLVAATRCLAVMRVTRHYHNAVAVLDLGELDHPFVATNSIEDNVVDGKDYGAYSFSRREEQTADEEHLFIWHTRVSWSARDRTAFEEVLTYCYTTNHM